jgi:hypothetical protein
LHYFHILKIFKKKSFERIKPSSVKAKHPITDKSSMPLKYDSKRSDFPKARRVPPNKLEIVLKKVKFVKLVKLELNGQFSSH